MDAPRLRKAIWPQLHLECRLYHVNIFVPVDTNLSRFGKRLFRNIIPVFTVRDSSLSERYQYDSYYRESNAHENGLLFTASDDTIMNLRSHMAIY
jgi:hypothetical protein